MASFTDNPELLSRFNPYVQQLPVETMVNVGQQKQQQYNEGVQKIQSQIDQIAGLDVVRDVDKQYLQTRLNDLGSNLKKVAAGDFSNYQLVNSVSGMASKIGKDPNVQNAVASAARYRKEVANMETAKKEGKSAIQNEWDFSNRANAWLSSSNLKQSFNESYTPFIDVDKKWMEVVKSLHPSLQEVDIAYELNPDGTPNFSKTLAAMQRVSKESVSSTQIENALRASLTPEELNQLSINGRYQFKDYSSVALAETSKRKYTSMISQNQEVIKNLEGLVSLSTSNTKIRKQALNTIKELENKNAALAQELNSEVDFILQNPDEAKAQIYKNGAITQFSQAHSWENKKENILSSPVKSQDNWEKNYAMDVAKLNMEKDKFDWTKYKDSFDMNLKALKQQEELSGSYSDAVSIYVGQSTHVKSPVIALKTDIQSLDVSAKQQKADFLKGNPDVSLDQLNNLIIDYKNGINVLGEDSKTMIPERWKSSFYNIVETENKKFRKESLYKQVEQEVRESDEFKKLEPSFWSNFAVELNSLGQPIILSTSERKARAAQNEFGDLLNKKLLEKTGVYTPYLTQIKTGKTESGDGQTAAKTNLDHLALMKVKEYEGGNLGIKGGAEMFKEEDIAAAREMLAGENRKDIMYQKLVQGDRTFLVMSDGTKEATIPIEDTELGFLPIDPNEPSASYKELYQTQAFNNGSTNPKRAPDMSYFQRYALPNTKLDVRADLEWDMGDTSRNYPVLMLNLGDNNWIDITVPKGLPRDSAVKLIKELTDSEIKQLFLANETVSKEDKEIIKNLK